MIVGGLETIPRIVCHRAVVYRNVHFGAYAQKIRLFVSAAGLHVRIAARWDENFAWRCSLMASSAPGT
jgi:hypothetical protein